MRATPRLLLLCLGWILSACPASGGAPPPASPAAGGAGFGLAAAPAAGAAAAPAIDEPTCSALFGHILQVTGVVADWESQHSDVRATFILQCGAVMTAEHVRCGQAATTLEAMRACAFLEAAEPPAPAAAEVAAVTCARPEPYGPVVVTAAQFLTRTRSRDRRHASFASSRERPLEACGAAASYFDVAMLACADGSYPLANANDVAAARAGNVGAGGRCGSIIDEYVVRCPEAEYRVFVDMYLCLPGQWPR